MTLSDLPKYNKAIYGFLSSAIVLGTLLGLDINISDTALTVLSSIITGVVVWSIPNAKP